MTSAFAILGCVQVFAGQQVSHWDFPRNIASVALMTEFAREHGLAVADALEGSGLSEGALQDHDRMIMGRQELAVATNLVNRLGDPANLGMRVGRGYYVGSFGIFGFACLTSSTLGDAVRFAARFYELSYGFCLPSVTVEGPVAALRLDLPDLTGPVADFLVRRDLAAIARVMAELLGRPIPFTAVEFAGPEPSSGDAEAREAFGVTPRYGSPANVARWPAALLDSRLPQASEMSAAMCEQQCHDLLERRRQRTGVARRVRERLASIDGEPHTIAVVARQLAMSERTLRRRLAEENTSFRELVEEVHRVLAEELLATGALSVEDVALRLGYAEATSFIAAFKRWTGTTPARYQRAAAPRARLLAV
ncbi:AraC family transcriptional regulator [Mycobacterium saskatchewanense]|uniref:AraC family transcriptional regulator n=1 Tax=Mycobacterium saskatchewanense TaxID=220927 RepID=UPI00138CD515|nr:AraC family transcriptional regulator [Mycobacterium saskatchewanense]BBX65699.1 AraC family transcriptional regulator [Mycobacterium saskatchewanense]